MKSKKNLFVIFLAVIMLGPNMNLSASAADKPATAAELALYNGPDLQQILEEGAKKEGSLTFYTTGILVQTVRPLVEAFQKKYPYIKVNIWRAGTQEMLPRYMQETKAGKFTADAIELTQAGGIILEEARFLQPFYSPNLEFIEEGAISKTEGGALRAGHYQSGISLAYNTKLLKANEVPKTYEDLLDPKWSGKMAMAGSNTGLSWSGGVLEHKGEEFIKKLSRQKIAIQAVSARALLDMVIAGEYLISPTTMDSHVNKSKSKGAPVNWVPLEPVPAYIGQIMVPLNSPHPHAAMLFVDFDLSRQGGELYKANGYDSPRKDIPADRTYKRYYGPYSTEQVKKWKKVFDQYFLK